MENRKSATCAVSEVSAASGSKEQTGRVNRNERLEAATIKVAEIEAGISMKFLPFPSITANKLCLFAVMLGKNSKKWQCHFFDTGCRGRAPAK